MTLPTYRYLEKDEIILEGDEVDVCNDGWDRKNYQYSWFEEKISLSEFEKRLMKSTCLRRTK